MGLMQILYIVFMLAIFISSFIDAIKSLRNIGTYIISGWFKHAVAYIGWFFFEIVIAAIAMYCIINKVFIFK